MHILESLVQRGCSATRMLDVSHAWSSMRVAHVHALVQLRCLMRTSIVLQRRRSACKHAGSQFSVGLVATAISFSTSCACTLSQRPFHTTLDGYHALLYAGTVI
jgi:hypothetical protein